MRKASAVITYDKNVLLHEREDTSLEEAIATELSWTEDSGIHVVSWDFKENEKEISAYIIHPQSIEVEELEKNNTVFLSTDTEVLCEKIKTAESQVGSKGNGKIALELQK